MKIKLNGIGSGSLKPERHKFTVYYFFALFLLGFILVIAGYFGVTQSRIDKEWIQTEGVVVDVVSHIDSEGSNLHTGIYEYEVSGQKYRVPEGSSDSFRPKIGESREVYYNPSNPADAKVKPGAFWIIIFYILPVFGVICMILAPYEFVKSISRGGKIKKLIENGQKLTGVLVDVEETGFSHNNKKTYRIIVASKNPSGATSNYVSDNIMNIGGLLMADFRKAPIPIDVYFDPSNYDNYYVDISDIPNLTPERISELLGQAVNRSGLTTVFPESIVPKAPTSNTNQNSQGDNLGNLGN